MKKITFTLVVLFTTLLSSSQNNSLNFDGSNDAVSLGQNYAFQTANPFTIEAWVKVTLPGFRQIISKLDQDFTGWGFQIADNGTLSGYLFSVFGSNSIYTEGTVSLVDNQWHHVAMTWDGVETITLYVDGEIEELSVNNQFGGELGPIDNTTDTHIGNYHGNGSPGEHFRGNIDDLRIWNTVRSSSEIFDNYQTELTGTEANLIGYYKFDIPNSSCDVQDCGPNEIHGERLGTTGANNLPQYSSDTPSISDVACGNGSSCELDVSENTLESIAIFPNPTSDKIYFEGLKVDTSIRILLYNLQGSLLRNYSLSENVIDVSELNAGLYLIEFEYDGRRFIQKIIKN